MPQIIDDSIFQCNHRIVIGECVTSKLENELIPHGAVEWSNIIIEPLSVQDCLHDWFL